MTSDEFDKIGKDAEKGLDEIKKWDAAREKYGEKWVVRKCVEDGKTVYRLVGNRPNHQDFFVDIEGIDDCDFMDTENYLYKFGFVDPTDTHEPKLMLSVKYFVSSISGEVEFERREKK